MRHKLIAGLLLLAALLTAGATLQDKAYDATRFDVDVRAAADGSVLVEETVTFRFQGGPFSYVFRELPTDNTDGITDIVAGVDGVPWPQGTGPGQVEITGRNPIEIVWHLSPTSNTTQTFTLAYRALGVVRQGDEADVLRWQALPDDYDYAIGSSRVTVAYPTTTELLAPPAVLAGTAQAAVGDGRAVFTSEALNPGDPLVVELRFPPDAFLGAAPAWQQQNEAQASRAWIWLSAAAAVLLAGLLAVIRAARGGQRSIPDTGATLQKPPVDLPPALAGYLFDRTVSWPHALATLFDLAGRGLLEIEEIGGKTWYRQAEFLVTRLEKPVALRPHEQALLDILFRERDGVERDAITLSEMGRLVTSSRWKAYTERVKDEADAEGFIDHAAERKGRRLLVVGLLLMVLVIPLVVATFLVVPAFGFWPLIPAAAVFLVGLLATIAGGTYSTLSAQGYQMATAFAPFRRFLRDVAKGKAELADPAYYAAYLPYATAFGVAEAWVKQQAKSDYADVPAYFKAASRGDEAAFAAFIVVISAASHSGGAATAGAGAAGAGAAGGGASGAG